MKNFLSPFFPAVIAAALLPIPFILGTTSSQAATTSCSTVAACVFGQNASSGYGVEGTSATNQGVVGMTLVNSKTAATGKAGVVGYDKSTNGTRYNSGVFGTSPAGQGVKGQSVSGIGVQGGSSSGIGVQGVSTSGTGVSGASPSGSAVLATTSTGCAVCATVTGNGTTYPYGTGLSSVVQVGTGLNVNVTTQGTGMIVSTSTGSKPVSGGGTAIVATASGFGDGIDVTSGGCDYCYRLGGGVYIINAMGSYGTMATLALSTTDSRSDLLLGQGVSGGISVDGGGNMILSGTLTQNGSPQLRTRGQDGQEVATFGERSSAPSLEDMGAAQLVDGSAYVRLDRAFANTIDPRAAYLVFITPQGESHGLYVTRISNAGFAVRENSAGRSSLAFDYRIVAKPFDSKAMRLPSMRLFPQLKRVKMPSSRFNHPRVATAGTGIQQR